MNDISKEYVLLFQAITQATQALADLQAQLQQAQQQAEALYITKGEEILPLAL